MGRRRVGRIAVLRPDSIEERRSGTEERADGLEEQAKHGWNIPCRQARRQGIQGFGDGAVVGDESISTSICERSLLAKNRLGETVIAEGNA
jgi:hypothetical protein